MNGLDPESLIGVNRLVLKELVVEIEMEAAARRMSADVVLDPHAGVTRPCCSGRRGLWQPMRV